MEWVLKRIDYLLGRPIKRRKPAAWRFEVNRPSMVVK